ncbi:hypothetical protein MPER_04825, partial [Moniliophthora perniciosa FA553]
YEHGSLRSSDICRSSYLGRLEYEKQGSAFFDCAALNYCELNLGHFMFCPGMWKSPSLYVVLAGNSHVPRYFHGTQTLLAMVRSVLLAKDYINYAHSSHPTPLRSFLTIDQTGERILLGRSRKYPPKLYSALAGFLEPAETFEDCVAREMWEEVGAEVWGIQYHSSQPWPYPANLMLGCLRRGCDTITAAHTYITLSDAKWFTRAEILGILRHATGTKLDSKTFSEKMEEEDQEWALKDKKDQNSQFQSRVPTKENPDVRIPPDSAMAGVLITRLGRREESNLTPKTCNLPCRSSRMDEFRTTFCLADADILL